MQHFQRAGFEPIPAATDYKQDTLSGWREWIPDASDLHDNAAILKEYIGQWIGAGIQWTARKTTN